MVSSLISAFSPSADAVAASASEEEGEEELA